MALSNACSLRKLFTECLIFVDAPSNHLEPRQITSINGDPSIRGMGWVDRIPRAGNLYIGGLYALYQTDLIAAASITHVLSVIDYELHINSRLAQRFPHLKHLHIRIDDDPNENLLKHFNVVCEYIQEGLKEGGVFIHCAMGKSRSATVACAHLMQKYGVSWQDALEQVCEGRPVCDPNPGFKEQLGIWQKMLHAKSPEERRFIYQKWEKTRFHGEWWEWEARRKREVEAKL